MSELTELTLQLEELNRIGIALSAERDMARLLDLILTKAREITGSDAGSLYVVETETAADGGEPVRRLRFKIAQNDSVTLPFREASLDITGASIAGHVALTGETVGLADAYHPPAGAPYSLNRAFDEEAGYRTCSVLAVPMRAPQGHVVGVLQLINPKRDRAARLTSEADVAAHVVPYGEHQETLVRSLASQAAIALENSRLDAEIRRLFEGFVRASVVAIEERDPATSGHSFRVANLTLALAEAVDRADDGPFAAERFSREQMRTLRYASLLHDFGKVGVREEVLVKAKKLHHHELQLLRERFKLARRARELASLRVRFDYLLAHGREAYMRRSAAFDAELAAAFGELDGHLEAIEVANEPNVLPDGHFERLREIAALEYEDVDGSRRALLRDEEVRVLSIRQGSLSEAERAQIESHVTMTYRFLTQIPWTEEIRRIPAIALGHHEKLNGTGYPNGLSAPYIPIQTRMMTISDIFDALSAADRPYKQAVPVERALAILDEAVRDGELDADLFALFVAARIFDRWLVEAPPY